MPDPGGCGDPIRPPPTEYPKFVVGVIQSAVDEIMADEPGRHLQIMVELHAPLSAPSPVIVSYGGHRLGFATDDDASLLQRHIPAVRAGVEAPGVIIGDPDDGWEVRYRLDELLDEPGMTASPPRSVGHVSIAQWVMGAALMALVLWACNPIGDDPQSPVDYPDAPSVARSTPTQPPTSDTTCERRAIEVDSYGNQVVAVTASFEYASDLEQMQAVYDTIRGLVATSPVPAWMRDCRHHDPALADAIRRAENQTQQSWRNIQATCRQELGPYGFDC